MSGIAAIAEKEKSPINRSRSLICAVASVLWMGLGQMINGQILKGSVLIAVYALILFYAVPVLVRAIQGLVTLGSTPMKEHSLFLMIYGILALICTVYLVQLYIANIVNAWRGGSKRVSGETLPSFKDELKTFFTKRAALVFIAPGLIAVSLVVILPLVFSILIGFTNYDLYHQPPGKLIDWVGLKNFINIFTLTSWARTFRGVLGWTIVWTVLATITPYTLGIATALVLNNKRLRGQRIFKAIYILPWAIPAYISILVWRGMFDTGFGLINVFLSTNLHLAKLPWLDNVSLARVALLIVNLWLGFSFPMMISDGVIKAIPPELYEAATIDGATEFQKARFITLPLLMFSIYPLFIMSTAGTFNNFNLIYLFNSGYPPVLEYQGAGGTDILISWLFKMTFTAMKYNYASAISLLIFFFVAGLSIYNFRRTRSYTEEDMMK